MSTLCQHPTIVLLVFVKVQHALHNRRASLGIGVFLQGDMLASSSSFLRVERLDQAVRLSRSSTPLREFVMYERLGRMKLFGV